VRSPLYHLSTFKAAYAVAQVLPRPIAYRVADGLAWWTLKSAPECLRMIKQNLGVVTGRSGSDLERLALENVRQFCRMLADYFLCAGTRTVRAKELVTGWEGLEHFDAAQARGKGTILITGHLGHWELGGLLLALQGRPMTVVTLPEPSPELTRWRETCRRQLGVKTIAVGPGQEFAFVEMLRTLRNNGCLAMLVDRPYSGTGQPVQQFGRETQYSTAATMLAHHTGAAIVPAFVIKRPDGSYCATAHPAIEMNTLGDLREVLPGNTQRIADVFEGLIRRNPEQWYNYVPVFSRES
jgi:KDO2-lipid IV(A) lauroyltransferase